jgi:predicted small metal-binding protein
MEEESMAEKKAEARVQPSGYRGDNPATAGPGDVRSDIKSHTPENQQNNVGASAPNDATLESGNLSKEGMGGEGKPIAQADGTAADLDEPEGINQKGGSSQPVRKTFRCADVGYTNCNWKVEGASEQEILPKIKEHASKVHHLEFKRPAEENVHRAIRDAA